MTNVSLLLDSDSGPGSDPVGRFCPHSLGGPQRPDGGAPGLPEGAADRLGHEQLGQQERPSRGVGRSSAVSAASQTAGHHPEL